MDSMILLVYLTLPGILIVFANRLEIKISLSYINRIFNWLPSAKKFATI